MKRQANPLLSLSGEQALAQYEHVLREQEDLTPISIRNYLSDLRHFMAWYEACVPQHATDTQVNSSFDLRAVTTLTLTRYRNSLQCVQKQKSTSVNRSLISVKRSFGWAIPCGFITYDPSRAVKLVGEGAATPRHLADQEEQALVAPVTKEGRLRDRTLIVLLLHTGLRARETCQLQHGQVTLSKRSGSLEVIGKRNTYREMPLNAMARNVFEEYLPTLSPDTAFLFPAGKTKNALSERVLGFIVKKYADIAKLPDVSPHDLRHRFGYRMAEAVPSHRLAQIMGHNSLDTTKWYIQGAKHDLQQAVETIAWTEKKLLRSSRTGRSSSMHWQFTPFALPEILAGAVTIWLAIIAWRRRSAPGALPFFIILLAATEYSLGYALQLGSSDLSTAIFWNNVQWPGAVVLPLAWLAFTLQYTGRTRWLTRRSISF